MKPHSVTDYLRWIAISGINISIFHPDYRPFMSLLVNLTVPNQPIITSILPSHYLEKRLFELAELFRDIG
jgi:hypothetical protein